MSTRKPIKGKAAVTVDCKRMQPVADLWRAMFLDTAAGPDVDQLREHLGCHDEVEAGSLTPRRGACCECVRAYPSGDGQACDKKQDMTADEPCPFRAVWPR